MAGMVSPSAIASAPKALLHDHLDGGLRVDTILELSDTTGWIPNLPTTDPTDLQAWFTAGAAAKDLLKYLATFEHTLAVMQDPAHIERIAFEAVEDLANDGVVYAELRFAPELHNVPFAVSTEAICAGFRRAEQSAQAKGQQISAQLIICAMRTEQRSIEVVEFVDHYRNEDEKVVAFDLAGAETGWPPSLHAEALAIARQRQINLTIHASEPPDLELISDALAHGAHRIGHGVRLDRDTRAENGELVLGRLATFIRDHQIHLEMAPTCNTQIGAVASVRDHPVIPFMRAGFNVGVNTDNRLMSNVSPSSELIALNEAHGLSWEDIECLVTNAISSGFAPLPERQRIIAEVVAPAYAALKSG